MVSRTWIKDVFKFRNFHEVFEIVNIALICWIRFCLFEIRFIIWTTIFRFRLMKKIFLKIFEFFGLIHFGWIRAKLCWKFGKINFLSLFFFLSHRLIHFAHLSATPPQWNRKPSAVKTLNQFRQNIHAVVKKFKYKKAPCSLDQGWALKPGRREPDFFKIVLNSLTTGMDPFRSTYFSTLW